MLCEQCRKRQATVHVTRIVDGDKWEMHLCEECAREKEDIGFDLEPAIPVNHLLGELLNYDVIFGQKPRQVRDTVRCPRCGLTYRQFTRTGLLGCSQCYEEFMPRLEPLLQRIHGSVQHTGKVPRRREGTLGLRRQLEALRQELNEAVAGEEYERAAQVRDKIRELEKQLETKG